jgi:hypothetical protein
MKSSGKHALSGDVEVDEFLVGGFFVDELSVGAMAATIRLYWK